MPRPNGPDELAALLRDDARFEPPATAVAAARTLQRRIAMRVAGQGANAATIGARIRMHIAELGSSFDRASAVVASWVTTTNTDERSMEEARLAFAGLRDDITSGFCAEVLAAELLESDLRLNAERTRGQDGIVRLVGEVRAGDNSPARASIIVLDQLARVIDLVDSDEVGLFSVCVTDDAIEVAIVPHARGPIGSTVLHTASVLPLRSRSAL